MSSKANGRPLEHKNPNLSYTYVMILNCTNVALFTMHLPISPSIVPWEGGTYPILFHLPLVRVYPYINVCPYHGRVGPIPGIILRYPLPISYPTNFDTQVPGYKYYIIITNKKERITVRYYELLLLQELQ